MNSDERLTYAELSALKAIGRITRMVEVSVRAGDDEIDNTECWSRIRDASAAFTVLGETLERIHSFAKTHGDEWFELHDNEKWGEKNMLETYVSGIEGIYENFPARYSVMSEGNDE